MKQSPAGKLTLKIKELEKQRGIDTALKALAVSILEGDIISDKELRVECAVLILNHDLHCPGEDM